MKIAASVMCADLMDMGSEIKILDQAGIDLWHIDIMDGNFVPNIALNFQHISHIKQLSNIPVDVHLMTEQPERFLEECAQLGVDYLSLHLEAIKFPNRILQSISSLGMKAGVGINPATEVDNLQYYLEQLDFILLMTVEPGFTGQKFIDAVLPKIKKVSDLIKKIDREIEIEVDGNIDLENGRKVLQAGADILVAGTSSVFKDRNLKTNLGKFRQGLR